MCTYVRIRIVCLKPLRFICRVAYIPEVIYSHNSIAEFEFNKYSDSEIYVFWFSHPVEKCQAIYIFPSIPIVKGKCPTSPWLWDLLPWLLAYQMILKIHKLSWYNSVTYIHIYITLPRHCYQYRPYSQAILTVGNLQSGVACPYNTARVHHESLCVPVDLPSWEKYILED